MFFLKCFLGWNIGTRYGSLLFPSIIATDLDILLLGPALMIGRQAGMDPLFFHPWMHRKASSTGVIEAEYIKGVFAGDSSSISCCYSCHQQSCMAANVWMEEVWQSESRDRFLPFKHWQLVCSLVFQHQRTSKHRTLVTICSCNTFLEASQITGTFGFLLWRATCGAKAFERNR